MEMLISGVGTGNGGGSEWRRDDRLSRISADDEEKEFRGGSDGGMYFV